MQTASPDQSRNGEARFLKRESDESSPPGVITGESFRGILFASAASGGVTGAVEPLAFFHDLNLDQIVDAITAGREEYDLKPFFYTRLTDLTAIIDRQEIMCDLEDATLFAGIKSFSEQMCSMRNHLAFANKSEYPHVKARWFLDTAEVYCAAVTELFCVLAETAPGSRGLRAFREYLARYTESDGFKTLCREAEAVKSGLAAIRYQVRFDGGSVTVGPSDSELDYTVVVEETFAKFKQDAATDYRVKTTASSGMNHVEAAILERVARLNPEAFQALKDFCLRHENFLELTMAGFDREIQFYVAYLEYAENFKRAGLKFCYPQISDSRKDVFSRDGFDLALAGKLLKENTRVVCNNFVLNGAERIFVITGPNQGGKTTFARTFGQLHYLASLGCPVPGTTARLFLADQIFTHFEREEDIKTLHGKLQDDLVRMHHIVEQATSKSIVIINEIFASTSVKDGAELGRKILEHLSRVDALCVCVTFLDQLASLNEKIVSMVAAVQPDNPTLRTFKVERKPADGLAYALAIAEKYRLTYDRLKARLRS